MDIVAEKPKCIKLRPGPSGGRSALRQSIRGFWCSPSLFVSSCVLRLCLLFIPVSSTPKAGEFGVRCDNRRRQFHPKKWHHRPDKWAIVARNMPVLVREIAVEKLVDCCCWWWCCHCDRRNGAQDELEFSVPEMTTVLRVYVPGGNHQGKVVEVGCIRLHLAVMTVSKVPCLTYNPGAHCTYGGE